MTESPSPSTKKVENRGFAVLLLLVFMLILGLLFILATLPMSALLSADDAEQEVLSLNTEESFPLAEGEAELMYPFNTDHLIKVTNELVSYVSFRGQVEKAVTINCPTPLVSINEAFILVADLGGYNFYLLDQNGLVLQGKTSAPIQAASVSPHGKTAFVMDEMHTKGVLRVLDERGKHILDWRVRDRLKSGYIIAMDFTADSQMIDVSLLNTDGASVKPYLTRVDLERQALATTVLQDGTNAFPLLYHSGEETIAVSSERVVKNQDAQAELWLSFQNIQEVAADESGLALLASPQAGEVPSLYYFSYDDIGNSNRGDANTGTVLGAEPYNLTSGFGRISVAVEDSVYILKQNNINEANHYTCGAPIVRQKFLSETHLLIICRNRVQIIRV